MPRISNFPSPRWSNIQTESMGKAYSCLKLLQANARNTYFLLIQAVVPMYAPTIPAPEM